MQWMKPDTTPSGRKNRVCQQMIQIDKHGGNHNEPSAFPVISEKNPR